MMGCSAPRSGLAHHVVPLPPGEDFLRRSAHPAVPRTLCWNVSSLDTCVAHHTSLISIEISTLPRAQFLPPSSFWVDTGFRRSLINLLCSYISGIRQDRVVSIRRSTGHDRQSPITAESWIVRAVLRGRCVGQNLSIHIMELFRTWFIGKLTHEQYAYFTVLDHPIFTFQVWEYHYREVGILCGYITGTWIASVVFSGMAEPHRLDEVPVRLS